MDTLYFVAPCFSLLIFKVFLLLLIFFNPLAAACITGNTFFHLKCITGDTRGSQRVKHYECKTKIIKSCLFVLRILNLTVRELEGR